MIEDQKSTLNLAGVHHLTAITSHAADNHRFYTKVLGMRLVKKTVNQDDVSAYHLFYADGRGTPGTDITFFDWPTTSERRGTNSIIRTSLRVKDEKSIQYWNERLNELGIARSEVTRIDNRQTLEFDDFEGQRLSFVVDNGVGDSYSWEKSDIPAEHQIRGLGPITISVQDLGSLHTLLTTVMNMERVREYKRSLSVDADLLVPIYVYQMKGEGPAAELHVAHEKNARPAYQGAGGVHHVAFRIPVMKEYEQWGERLRALRIGSSGPVDRYYFKSLYFREPNGILFELATDQPGFSADEPLEVMGERLALPPFLEGKRKEIEKGLRPL